MTEPSNSLRPPPRQPPPRPPGDRPLDISILISICTIVPVLILVVSAVLSTAICCWFFHRKQRRRDLHGKGEVIVFSENLQRAMANQEGRLLFNVALVNVRVCISCTYPIIASLVAIYFSETSIES
jgi:hypothetical protein